MKKIVAVLLVTALVLSLVPFSAFAVGVTGTEGGSTPEVASISYRSVKLYERYAETDGEWMLDQNEEKFFFYHLGYQPGDVLTVIYTDRSTKMFTCTNDEFGGVLFVASDGEVIDCWSEFLIVQNQHAEHWYAGNTYRFEIEYSGKRATVPVAIVENPVKSIEYIPAEDRVIYFETNGHWLVDEQDETYFHYDGVCSMSTGDRLIVVGSDGGRTEYVLTVNEETREMEFVSADGRVINRSEVEMADSQYREHFTLGGNNYYWVEYMRRQTYIPVLVIQNPVKSVVYTPVSEPITVFENTDGEWDVDSEGETYFRYNAPWFKPGDRLSVTYSETGDTVVYEFRSFFDEDGTYNYGPYSEDNELLAATNELYVTYAGHWSLGDGNSLCVRYMGVESNYVPVSVIENPVYAIRYEKVNPAVYVEGSNLYYDSLDDAYYYSTPWFNAGDRLVIINKYGDETVYTCAFDEGTYEYYFVSDSGERIENTEISTYSDQRKTPWTVGGKNEYSVEYLGRRYSLFVTIVENPVKAIRFESAAPVEYIEGVNRYYDPWNDCYFYNNPMYQDGDRLYVIGNDNSTTVYTFSASRQAFVLDSGDQIDSSELNTYSYQKDNPWTVGGRNEYFIEYSGRTCSAFVTIKENTVKSIEYIRSENVSLIENTDGYWQDRDGEMYFNYSYPAVTMGDKLIVTDKKGGAIEYVYSEDKENGDFIFRSEDGQTIDPYMVRFNDGQYTNPWHVGTDNEYYVEYCGVSYTLYAEIKANPVKGISFEPASEPLVAEGVNCYRYFDDDGTEHIEYDEPDFREGDKLTVLFTDDTEKVYTYSFDRETNETAFIAADGEVIPGYEVSRHPDLWNTPFEYLHQENTPWHLGEGNEYVIEYMGQYTTVAVTMIPNPVESIEFTKKTPTSYIEGTHMYHDEWWFEDLYEMPRIEAGDVLSVTYADPSKGTVDYTARYDLYSDSTVFVSSDGEIIETENNPWLSFFNNQYDTPWTVGTDNYYTISYFGKEVRVPVEIIGNTIAGIIITPVRPYTLYEGEYTVVTDSQGNSYKEYRIPDFEDGDILTIIDTEGGRTEYVLTFCEEDGEHYFICGGEKIHPYAMSRSSEQALKPWTVGGGNYFTVELYGAKTRVPVTIVESDVKAVKLVKVAALSVDENTNGELVRDDKGELFYRYNPELITVGDRIIVTYKNNKTVAYTVYYDYENNVGYAMSDSGELLDENEVDIYDNQYDEHWTVGVNYYYITFRGVTGTVPVVINKKGETPETPADGFVMSANGTLRYYVNGEPTYAGVVQFNGKLYYINSTAESVRNKNDYYVTKTNGLVKAGYYDFDADGVMAVKTGERITDNLIKDPDGMIRYYENGAPVYAGIVQDLDGNYYYIGSDLTAVTGRSHYVSRTNGLVIAGTYSFDENGIMQYTREQIGENLFIDPDGKIRYYQDGAPAHAGVVQDFDGYYYYIGSDCTAVTGRSHYVSLTNGLVFAGTYSFDENGVMQYTREQIGDNLFIDPDGEIRYYIDGEAQYQGLVKDYNGNLYYINSTKKAAKNILYYITNTNGLLPAGNYMIGDDGKLEIICIGENLYIDADGNVRYIVNGEAKYQGVVQAGNGSYYYINSTKKAVKDKVYYITKTNGLIPAGSYTINANGTIAM